MCCSNPHSSLKHRLQVRQIHLKGGTSLGRPLPLLIISWAFGLRGLPGAHVGFLVLISDEALQLNVFSLFLRVAGEWEDVQLRCFLTNTFTGWGDM